MNRMNSTFNYIKNVVRIITVFLIQLDLIRIESVDFLFIEPNNPIQAGSFWGLQRSSRVTFHELTIEITTSSFFVIVFAKYVFNTSCSCKLVRNSGKLTIGGLIRETFSDILITFFLTGILVSH